MPERTISADRNLILAQAVIFLCAALIITVLLWLIVSVRGAASQAYDRSNAIGLVVSATDRLERAVIDAETGERGFALTRREDYLAPFTQGLADADDAAAKLRALAQSEPDLSPEIARALETKTEALENMARNLERFRTAGRRAVVYDAAVKSSVDAHRAAIGALRERAVQQKSALDNQIADTRGEINNLISALIGAVLVSGVLGAILLRQEAKRLHEVGAELVRANGEALSAQKRAEEADAAKTRFLAMASHDMRQPLHALTLYLSSLKRRVDNAQARDIVGNMEKAAESLTRMFSGLLDLARIEAGVLTPRIKAVAVADLFDALERELRNDCERDRVELIIAPSSLFVLTDPELMQSILRNLLTNAVKYAPGGRVLFGCRRRGERVRIEVHDEGPGIPEEKLQLMFGEFVRLEVEKKAAKEGLGLGLSIASRLAQLLGVELTVASRVGKGTSFWITAPMATPAASVSSAESAKREDLSGLRIAVLDDEPDSLAAMVRVLEDAGGAAKGYGYADRYVAAVSAGEKFDLLIVDPALRRQALAGLKDGARPPEIIVTGSTDPNTLAQLKQSGSAWLVKPIAERQLLQHAARAARPLA